MPQPSLLLQHARVRVRLCGRVNCRLRYLAKRFLNRVIQAGDKGHDSVEDAVAAMDLALLKAANGPAFGVAEASSTVLVPTFLADHGSKRVLVIDSSDNAFLAGTSADIVMCASSAAVFHKLTDAVRQKGGAEFIVARCVRQKMCISKRAVTRHYYAGATA